MRVLQNSGYKRPTLDALCQDFNIKRSGHAAFEDADILMTICKLKSEIFNQLYGFAFADILHHLNRKLPLPIRMGYTIIRECSSYQELTSLLCMNT